MSAKRADGWWIALPEHEGDLKPDVASPPAKTANRAKDANVGTVGNLAKGANTVPQGDVGIVGTLDARPETGADDQGLGYLARRDPSVPDPRPPCHTDDPEHETCWDAMVGRCLLDGASAENNGNPVPAAPESAPTPPERAAAGTKAAPAEGMPAGLRRHPSAGAPGAELPPISGATCTICGEPLDPAVVAAGFTDHGTCQ